MTTLAKPYIPARLRKVQRWTLWLCALTSLSACLAYATIPWWTPTTWLAGQIAANLQTALNRPVQIGRLNLSWFGGVSVEQIVIHEPAGAGRPPFLARLGRVSCGLSPLKTLLFGKVSHLRFDDVQFWIAQLPDGRLNIQDIPNTGPARLPTIYYAINNAVAHVNLPDAPAEFRMDHLEFKMDLATGLLRIHGDATAHKVTRQASTPSGRLWINGRVNVPRLKREVQLSGGGELQWENVNLKEVPFHRIKRLGLDSVTGRTNGHVKIEAFPDLGVDFDVNVQLDGVTAQRRRQPGLDQIQDGRLAASGHWDPNVDYLLVKRFDYRMASLRLHDVGQNSRPAVLVDRLAREPLQFDLAGEVEDIERLRQQFASVDAAMRRAALRTSGSCTFATKLSQSAQRWNAQLTVDASAASLVRPGDIALPAGVPKRASVDFSCSPDDLQAALNNLQVDLGDLHITAKGVVTEDPAIASMPSESRATLPALPPVQHLLAKTAFEIGVKTAHLEQAGTLFPALNRAIGTGRRNGPIQCDIRIEPDKEMQSIRWSVLANRETELELADYFHKPKNATLLAEGACLWSGKDPGRFQNIRVRVAADSSAFLLDQASFAWIHTEPQPGETEVRCEWNLPVRITDLERWRACLPRGDAWLTKQIKRSPLELGGELSLTLTGAASIRPGDLAWQTTLAADISPARLRLGNQINKRSGDPARMRVHHQHMQTRERREDTVTMNLLWPGLTADAGYTQSVPLAHPADVPPPREEDLQLTLAVSDARRAIDSIPALLPMSRRYSLAGAMTLDVAATLSPETAQFDCRADVDAFGFRTPDHSVIKTPGSACRLQIGGQSDSAGARRWSFTPGHAQLAKTELQWSRADASLDPAWSQWLSDTLHNRRWAQPPSVNPFVRAGFTGKLHTLADDNLPLDIQGRLKLQNNTFYADTLSVRAGGSRMTISGRATMHRNAPDVQLGLYGSQIDLDEVLRLRNLVPASDDTSAADETEKPKITLGDWLRHATLDVQTRTDRLLFRVPSLALDVRLDPAAIGVKADDGTVAIPFLAGVDGGVASGSITFFFKDSDPHFDLQYSVEKVAPGKLVDAYMKRSFPGYVATGPLTLIDRSLQRMSTPEGEPNEPVGSGELIIDGGYVMGKSAPDWLTKIFPGLNLTRYDFIRMHDWFVKHADGRVDHRMIFQGQYYHVYMVGYNEPNIPGQPDAERSVHYEVGIDLLARFDSKYWVDTEQGRIPLFVKNGLIDRDGVMVVDEVRFSPASRILESLLVQNNPAITAYYAIRKQVLGPGETQSWPKLPATTSPAKNGSR